MTTTTLIKSKDVAESYEFAALPSPSGIVVVALRVDAQGVRRVSDFALEMSPVEALTLAKSISDLLAAQHQAV
jgi:hypothetical protein